MKGMVDGRWLKRAWDADEIGALLRGAEGYPFEADADDSARFTRLRQVSDFLRCRPVSHRKPKLDAALADLDAAPEGWARAAAIFLRRTFPETASGL